MPHLRTVFFALTILCCAFFAKSAFAQVPSPSGEVDLTRPQDYVLKRVSSYDRSGGNADYRKIEPGQTLTVLDVDGPATLTHIWFTLATDESYHLKKIVLRMYWDGEKTPSVETPLGDFFGLGLGEYYTWESELFVGGAREGVEQLFPDAVSEACADYGDERREGGGGGVLLQSRLPRACASAAGGHALFSCAIPAGAAESWDDERMGEQRRSARR